MPRYRLEVSLYQTVTTVYLVHVDMPSADEAEALLYALKPQIDAYGMEGLGGVAAAQGAALSAEEVQNDPSVDALEVLSVVALAEPDDLRQQALF